MDSKKNIEYICKSCEHREILTEVPNFCTQCGTSYKHPVPFSLEKPVFLPLDEEETRMYDELSAYASKDSIVRKMCYTCDARELTYGDYIKCKTFHQFLIPRTEENTHFCENYQNERRIICPVCHYAFSKRHTNSCPVCHQYERHTEYDVRPSIGKWMAFLFLVFCPIVAMICIIALTWNDVNMGGMFSLFLVIFPFAYMLFMMEREPFTNTTSIPEWRITPQAEPEEDEDDDEI